MAKFSREMSVLKPIEESEIDFKEPLAPEGCSTRRLSQFTDTSQHSQFPPYALPPINVIPTFGLIGSTGIITSAATFLLNIIADILLMFALKKQDAERAYDYYDRTNHSYPFTLTLLLTVVPLIIVNAISLTWYIRSKHLMGGAAVFYRKSMSGKIFCIILHIFLIGPIVRYYDTIHYGRRTSRFVVEVDLGGQRGSVQTLTPIGETNSALQQAISRDTAMVDIQCSYFKDVPQLLFQMILLNSLYYTEAGNAISYRWTLTTQVVKILVGLFSVSWATVSYQDELRRMVPGKMQLTWPAIIVSLLWRAGTISARVVSIATFMSLKVDEEGGLVKSHQDNSFLSFPLIMAFIILIHWGFMIIWIYSQKTNFCTKEEGTPQPCFEFLYDIVMSWVHVFDYVNMKDSLSRRRMTFLYFIILTENTLFILIWYFQIITIEMWMRVLVIFGVEFLFIIGICSAVGYFSFLHPDKSKVRQINTTWKK